MDHTVKLMNNGKIVLATVGNRLSIEEWAAVSEQILEFLQNNRDAAHIVVDMKKTKRHPMNALEIHRVTTWANHPHIKTTNHITDNMITSTLGEVVIGLVANTYKSMPTLHEAFKHIIKVDPSIIESIDALLSEARN